MPTALILIGGSGMRRRVSSGSKTSDTVPLAELGAKIARRKAELAMGDPPRNSGKGRTASKRALLEAIEGAGGKW